MPEITQVAGEGPRTSGVLGDDGVRAQAVLADACHPPATGGEPLDLGRQFGVALAIGEATADDDHGARPLGVEHRHVLDLQPWLAPGVGQQHDHAELLGKTGDPRGNRREVRVGDVVDE